MELSIKEAKKCAVATGKHSPRVGAVAVKDHKLVGCAYRGEDDPDDHAEQTLLKKIGQAAAGCTVFSTLEPCTHRSLGKDSCADLLINLRVDRVVIGTIDPNPSIGGKGIIQLREAGIDVALYESRFMKQIEAMDWEFRKDQARFAHHMSQKWDLNGVWFGRVQQTEANTLDPAAWEVQVGLEFRQTKLGISGRSVVIDREVIIQEETSYGAFLGDDHFAVMFFTRKPGYPSYGTCMFSVVKQNQMSMSGYSNRSETGKPDSLVQLSGKFYRQEAGVRVEDLREVNLPEIPSGIDMDRG